MLNPTKNTRCTCAKCGAPIRPTPQPTALQAYCQVCRVRLGFTSRVLCGVRVRPDDADYWERQLTEPIYETWIIETFGLDEVLDDPARRVRRLVISAY